MLARVLKSGSLHDVAGYVTREFHDKKEYPDSTWRILDSYGIYTQDFKKMVQSFEAAHGFMPGKESPAGHISISFDKADAMKMTDDFMVQLAKEYMEGMKIKDTQYMIVRHLETEHPHFHIVYNRVNMQGRAIDERNNFKRSDKVVKAIKDKYKLTYSPLKEKYEALRPELETKIRVALYGCTSWEEFIRRMECAGVEFKFHDDINTGEHIGVKFKMGDVTMTGSKVHRNFTYGRLSSVFELNERQGQTQESSKTAAPHPRVTYESKPAEQPGILETVVESIGNGPSLFQVGPGFNAEEEAFKRTMDAEEAKRKRKKKRQRKI